MNYICRYNGLIVFISSIKSNYEKFRQRYEGTLDSAEFLELTDEEYDLMFPWMTYTIARMDDEGNMIALETFDTYSEAEMNINAYFNMYPYAYVDIIVSPNWLHSQSRAHYLWPPLLFRLCLRVTHLLHS